MLTSLIVSGISFFIYLIVNVILFRVFTIRRPLLCFGVTTLVLLPLPILGSILFAGNFPVDNEAFWSALNTALLFGFLGVCYFQFYAMLEGSITIRMLGHIYQAPGKSMSFEELYKEYPFIEVLERKMGFAGQSGYIQIELKNGKKIVSATPGGLFIGKHFNNVKTFCRWGQGG